MNNQVKEFVCDNDLTKYIDSLLFDSGTEIARMKWENGDWKVEIDLRVCGDVNIYYKGDRYRYPSDFPEDLRELIKNDRWFDLQEENGEPIIYVDNNNWFEYIYYIDNDSKGIHYTDGVLEECDVSQMTQDEIFETMLWIANEYTK